MLITLVIPLFFCCLGISIGQNTNYITYEKGNNCGKRIEDDDAEKVRIFITIPGRVPWHVGIYKYDTITNKFELTCGGTIISPHIVLTAATCVYDSTTRTAYNPYLFRITAGKLAFKWASPDTDAQDRTVNDIVIPETFLDDINSNSKNVALLNLDRELRLNDFVLPICLDLNSAVYNVQKRYLQTAGWGFDGGVSKWPYLKEASFQFMRNAECIKTISSETNLKMINYDKLCILTPGGTYSHDIGGGLVYKKGSKYHLVGVISAKINNKFMIATNLSTSLDWLNNTLPKFEKVKSKCKEGKPGFDSNNCQFGTDETQETCPIPIFENYTMNSCLLPNQQGGVSYTELNCDSNCELKGCVYVNQNVHVNMQCGKGFAPKDFASKPEYICFQGSWFPKEPKCIKNCRPLKEPNIVFHCSYKDEVIDCEKFMRPGTVARYSCGLRFRLQDPSTFSGFLSCGENGAWKEPMPECVVACGVEYLPPSHRGLPAPRYRRIFKRPHSYGKHYSGALPWHVVLYRHLDINGTYVQICGGTLVSETMVLTAAECMFSEDGEMLKEEDLRVMAGKVHRSWDERDEFQQSSHVNDILIPETYSNDTFFENNIALLNTERFFILSDFILPACLHYWSELSPFMIPNYGFVAGWGLNEEGKYSESLQTRSLQYKDTDVCRNEYNGQIDYNISDLFCAELGERVFQKGDIGGGVTATIRGRHYVIGVVVSNKFKHFGLFTNVSIHLDWVVETIRFYIDQRKLTQI